MVSELRSRLLQPDPVEAEASELDQSTEEIAEALNPFTNERPFTKIYEFSFGIYRTERSFAVGDSVFVKLQPYRQGSVVVRSNQKLAPKYYGPYKIIDKCGKVAYKLLLPTGSLIHPVFHVSQLKAVVGNVHTSSQLPSIVSDVLLKEPVAILDRKMVKRQGRAATMVLVHWTNETEAEATWEFLFDLQKKFPAFEPCGQGSSNRGALI